MSPKPQDNAAVLQGMQVCGPLRPEGWLFLICVSGTWGGRGVSYDEVIWKREMITLLIANHAALKQ